MSEQQLSEREAHTRMPSWAQLLEQLPVRQPGLSEREEQTEFPPYGEVEYERSVITIPLRLRNQERPVDVMSFDAYMRIIREPPITSGIGYRQFEFLIDAWELTNVYSRGLDANVTITLSKTVQPKSICYAMQQGSDFPAQIVYNAIYDVYLDRDPVVQNQPGVAIAIGVREIPPRNVTVAFEKPYEGHRFAFSSGM